MIHCAGTGMARLLVILAASCALVGQQTGACDAREQAFVVYHLPHRVLSAPVRADLEARILNLLNDARIQQGLPPLTAHRGLQAVARAHGVDMFANGFMSHRSRDGRTPLQRVSDRQIRLRAIGENIAFAVNVPRAHAALMASDEHRRNILSPEFRLVGIAVLDGGDGLLVVQDFGDAPPKHYSTGNRARAVMFTRL